MANAQQTEASIPFPSKWAIHADIAGRPIIWGTFMINSIKAGKVIGNINFRGTPIPITGNWNESTKQITFSSAYASFTGNLKLFDDASIKIRHLLLEGNFIMKPPSPQAGERGSWVATTDTHLTGPPTKSDTLPPVGVFLTSDIMNQQQLRH